MFQVCAEYADLTEISANNCQSLGRKKEDKKLYRNFSLKQSKSSPDGFIKCTITNKE